MKQKSGSCKIIQFTNLKQDCHTKEKDKMSNIWNKTDITKRHTDIKKMKYYKYLYTLIWYLKRNGTIS